MFHAAIRRNEEDITVGVFYGGQLLGEFIAAKSMSEPDMIHIHIYDYMEKHVASWDDFIEDYDDDTR